MTHVKNRLMLTIMAAMIAVMCFIPLTKADAASATTVTLKQGKTYTSYDITGDGKKDTIKITRTKGGMEYNKLTVSINGKKTVYNRNYYDVLTKIIKLQNGKVYLWIKGEAENGDDPWEALYQYNSSTGKLKKALNFQTYTKLYSNHSGTTITKVSGNSIYVTQYMMSTPLAGVNFTYTYKYSGGKFARTSSSGTIKSVTNISGYGTLKYKRTLYTSATSTKKVATVAAGTKAKATAIYMSGSRICVKIKTKSGTTGWVKCSNKFAETSLLFKNTWYAG